MNQVSPLRLAVTLALISASIMPFVAITRAATAPDATVAHDIATAHDITTQRGVMSDHDISTQRGITTPSAVAQDVTTSPDNPFVPGPPWFVRNLVYYNSFDADRPEINTIGAPPNFVAGSAAEVARQPAGMLGHGVSVTGNGLSLKSAVFSPDRPCTLSFWWALPADLPIDGSFSLFSLTGRGFVSAFCRGKGEWCALQRPAGVLQVYNLPGIQNVNDIYDTNLADHIALKAGVWHHTAIIFRQASTVELYTDGKLAAEVSTTGRPFTAADGLINLSLGSGFGGGLHLDEIAILDRAVDPALIEDYYRGIIRIRQYTH